MRLVSLSAIFVAVAAACGPGDAPNTRSAVESSPLTLLDAIAIARTDAANGNGNGNANANANVAVGARLIVSNDPTYSVDVLHAAVQTNPLTDVRIDSRDGTVISRLNIAGSANECADAVSLEEATAAAQEAVGGEAVSIELDDDGGCTREVMVLTDAGLMEAEVDEAGNVVEVEPADDDELEGADGLDDQD